MWLPLTTLHLLIGAAILFSPREEGWASSISPQFIAWERSWKGRTIWAAACLLIVALSARFSFGAANAFARIIEPGVSYDSTITIDPTLPNLNKRYERSSRDNVAPPRFDIGTKGRFRFLSSNSMLPPKLMGGAPWMFDRAIELNGENYFMAVPDPPPLRWMARGDQASVTFLGAALNKPVREWSVLEAECLILSNRHLVSRTGPPIYWMRILKGCVVADPRFPPSMRRVPIIRQTQNQ